MIKFPSAGFVPISYSHMMKAVYALNNVEMLLTLKGMVKFCVT